MPSLRRFLAGFLCAVLIAPAPATASVLAAQAVKVSGVGLPGVPAVGVAFNPVSSLTFALSPTLGAYSPSVEGLAPILKPAVSPVAARPAPQKQAQNASAHLQQISSKKKLQHWYFDASARNGASRGAVAVRAPVGPGRVLLHKDDSSRGSFSIGLGNAIDTLTSPDKSGEEKRSQVAELFAALIDLSRAIVAMDAQRFFGQVQALLRLKNVVSGAQSLGSLRKEEMTQVVADINALGFFYIKVAQTLSNTAVVMSEEASDALKVFQEHVPTMPAEQVRQVIREEFGKDASEVFTDFDAAKPIASGSIAQVYRAKVKIGWGGRREVIVKVQRPGLKDTLDWNRKLNRTLLALAAVTWDPAAVKLLDFIKDQVMGLEDQFEGELDFKAEARRMFKFRLFHWLTPGVHVPKLFARFSTGRVLTMGVLPGKNVDEAIQGLNNADKTARTDETRSVRKHLFSRLLSVLLYQVIFLGELHADLHPGNMLATKRGTLGLLDWSQSFRTRGMVMLPVRALYHLFMGHPRGFARALHGMGTGGTERTKIMKAAEDIFAKHKVRDMGLREFRRAWKSDEVFTEEHFMASAHAAAELLKVAQKEHGYRMSPRYTQMLRSAVPVLGSLTALAVKMPKGDLARVAAWKSGLYLPMAAGIAAVRGALALPVYLLRKLSSFPRAWWRDLRDPAKPPLWSWARVKYSWKYIVESALSQPGSASSIARGVALGIFIAMTPTVGIQWAVILLVSRPLRANMTVAMSLIWITNPLTMWPVYTLDYFIGSLFWPGAPAAAGAVSLLMEAMSGGVWVGLQALVSVGLPVFLTALAGGAILGAALAVPLYFLTLRAAKAYRPSITAAGEETSGRERGNMTDWKSQRQAGAPAGGVPRK